MQEMKELINNISALCKLRYEVTTSPLFSTNGACTIAETMNEEIRRNIIYLKATYSVDVGNVELFLKFFWGLLEENEIWIGSVKDFGKDWEFAKEMLSEMLKETLYV